MRVIISTTLKDNYSNFVVVKDFKSVEGLSNVSLLVLHEFEEEDFNVGIYINKLHKGGIDKFLYICPNPRESVKSALVGVRGKVYTDDFYYTDEEELLALESEFDYEETGLSTAGDCTKIIKDFLIRFNKGDETINAPAYIDQVNYALADLSSTVNEQHEIIMSMGNTALETYSKANALLSNMAKRRKELEEKLDAIAENQSLVTTAKHEFSSNILFFPTTNYKGSAKVLLIRELSPCRYLTSFILAYEHYLHYEKNKRAKLIFVHQKGKGVGERYDDYCKITQESMHMESLYNTEIVATNNPKTDVMSKLLSGDFEVAIVVDRLYGANDIVAGRVTKLTAVSGVSDVARFKASMDKTIVSTVCRPNYEPFCTLRTISKYPESVDMRKVAYIQVHKDSTFKKLDSLLGIQ